MTDTTKRIDQERAAFEACEYVCNRNLNRYDNGTYIDDDVQGFWIIWLAARATPVSPAPLSEQLARDAIDGAIAYGRQGINKPPSDDHWLMEYWRIGQQLAELGKTSAWDNVTPVAAPAKPQSDLHSAITLPPLPERDGDWAGDDWYTADTLQNYARHAAAELMATAQSEPVTVDVAAIRLIADQLEQEAANHEGNLADSMHGWAAALQYVLAASVGAQVAPDGAVAGEPTLQEKFDAMKRSAQIFAQFSDWDTFLREHSWMWPMWNDAFRAGRTLYTAPVPVPATVPEGLRQIGELLRTQDNRCTDQPMFIVQQKRRAYGFDPEYSDDQVVWLDRENGHIEATADEAAELNAEYQETGRERDGWTRTGYHDTWEFVTACFTEQGCKDYLGRDGHNLKEPRIYADGSYRNEEYRTLRKWLLSLAAPAAVPQGVEAQKGQQ